MKIVSESVDGSTTDFRPLLLKLKSRGVEGIFLNVLGESNYTVEFVIIAWGGVLDPLLIFQKLWSGYFAKVTYEVAATPITYFVVNWRKRVEEVDTFDENTNFTPFSIKI